MATTPNTNANKVPAPAPATNAQTASAPADPKKAKKEARKLARRAARDVIRSCMKDAKLMAQVPENLRKAIVEMFTAMPGGGGGGQTSMADKLHEFFAKLEVGKGIDELELFKQFKIGRGEMRKKVRAIIRDNEPENRLWIAFDEKTESWVLVAKGAKAPAEWKGYLPTENADKK